MHITTRDMVFAAILLMNGLLLWAPPMSALEESIVSVTTLASATSDETKGTAVATGRCRETAATVTWSSGAVAGAVVIETSDDPAFTGRWAPKATVTFSEAESKDEAQITGFQQWTRARVDTPVSGGSVTVSVGCN